MRRSNSQQPKPVISRRSSSLFGAVMQKLEKSTNSRGTNSTTITEEEGEAPSTPIRNPPRNHHHEQHQHQHQHQQDNETSSSRPAGFMSPTGKSIMNIVNSFVMNSPFRFQSPKAKRRLLDPTSSNDNDDGGGGGGSTTPTRKRKRPRLDSPTATTTAISTPLKDEDSSRSSFLAGDDHWREIPILHGQAQIMDWTLQNHNKIRLECSSSHFLATLIHSTEWKDVLCYWQYHPIVPTTTTTLFPLQRSQSFVGKQPSSQPLLLRRLSSIDSTTTHNNNYNNKLRVVGGGIGDTSSSSSSKMTLQVSKVQGMEESKTFATNTSSSLFANANPKDVEQKQQQQQDLAAKELAAKWIRNVRNQQQQQQQQDPTTTNIDNLKHEWQQSFRSLYMQWCQRIQQATTTTTTAARRTTILNCYFYCMIDYDHVVLFRVDDNTTTTATANESVPLIIPRVFVSSCGEEFVKLLLETGANEPTILPNPYIPTSSSSSTTTTKAQNATMSPSVQADLEALRKAQAYGEIAGADVSIKFKNHNTNQKSETTKSLSTPKEFGITLSGFDNVACFFEVYMNTFGNLFFREGKDIPQRLPQLLCPREMGPFLYSSMKSLRACRRVRETKTNTGTTSTSTTTTAGQSAAEGEGIVDIDNGPILPCTARRIMGLVASKLSTLNQQQRKRNNQHESLVYHTPPRTHSHNTPTPSHYVVLHTTQDTGGSSSSISEKKSASHSWTKQVTLSFNGDMGEHHVDESDETLITCRLGAVVQLMVWDASRSTVVACKVGPLL